MVIGDAFDVRRRNPRRCINPGVGIDFDVHNLFAQLIGEVLSQYAPTCLSLRVGMMISRTIQFIIMPASSKSLMLMSPFGFEFVTRWFCISIGHLSCHIM